MRKNKLVLVEIESENYEKPDSYNWDDYSANHPEYIHQAIKELPQGSRVIFNLFALEGYKHREISEMLKISESTSKSQYLRARSILMSKINLTVNEN